MKRDRTMAMVSALRALPALLALGCATTSNNDRAGTASDVATALSQFRPGRAAPVNGTGHAMAFLATTGSEGQRLVAYDITEGRVLWTQAADLAGRIEVGRDVVVHAQRRGGLAGRDLINGGVRWQHALGDRERLLGYAVDGDLVAIVVQSGSDELHGGRADVLGLDARTGGQRWRRALRSANVGAPAARGGLVAVLMQSQYVLLLDGNDGHQLAQILSNEEAATFVRALPEGFVFGSRGAFLAEPATARAQRKSPGYAQAKLPKFVRPFYHYDMYRPEQSDYSAIDRNRLVWRLAPSGEQALFRDGMVVVHNYRFFFGLDAVTGALRWAYNQPSVDAVSSDHTGAAIVFVTSEGEVGALEATTGRKLLTAKVPGVSQVRGATFDAEGLAGDRTAAGAAPSLGSVLASIVWDPDKRFSDVKVFAVEQMAGQPGAEVTADLLKIGAKDGLPDDVYQKAADALIQRRDSAAIEQFVAALKVHGDYARDIKPHGVATLARAAVAMQREGRALAPALIEHLRLPETDPGTATQLARALAAMGATEALPALSEFVSIYRADPAFESDPGTLIAVTEAILSLGGAPERKLLTFIAAHPLTVEGLRLHLGRALEETAPPAPAAAPAAAPAPTSEGAKPASGGGPRPCGVNTGCLVE